MFGRKTPKLNKKKDSQMDRERLIQPEKKKQTEKWDKVDRKFPNTKK